MKRKKTQRWPVVEQVVHKVPPFARGVIKRSQESIKVKQFQKSQQKRQQLLSKTDKKSKNIKFHIFSRKSFEIPSVFSLRDGAEKNSKQNCTGVKQSFRGLSCYNKPARSFYSLEIELKF